MALHWVDIAIIAVYFAVVVALGLWLGRSDGDSEDDYFIAGRKLGWFTVGASLFASNISSEHLIGLASDGYRTGFAVGNYEWGATMVLLLLGAVFVPFYLGSRIRTMPEFLERRFGTGARVYLSLITIVANVLVRISVALYAGALVMRELFGLNQWVAIVLLAVTTVFYTAAGGLKAVVYTDAIQAVILLVGSLVLTWIAVDQVGGIDVLIASVPASTFDMVLPADDPEMPWPGLLLGVPILGTWYWCTDQVIVQRVLGAKGIHEARLGTLFAAFLKIFPVFLFVLPGVCAAVLFPEIEAKAAFPTLLRELMPVGLKGLVAAGLIAALMSSLDSTLNSTGTLVSLDFYQRFWPKASSRELVRVGRVTTALVMVFGMVWVLVVERAESLFQYLQQVNGAISPPIAAAFLVGVFWRRANHAGVMAALVGGLVVGVALLWVAPLPFLIAAGVTFAASLALLVAGSLATAPPRPEQWSGLTWGDVRSLVEGETTPSQRRRYRVMALGLAATMVALWVLFSGVFSPAPGEGERVANARPDEIPRAPEIAFSLNGGRLNNHFYRRGPVAAHVVVRSGEPRIIAAFPAGNSGAGLWFEGGSELALDGNLVEAAESDMRGVRGRFSASAERLEVRSVALGSVRFLREVMHGNPVPREVTPRPVFAESVLWERERADHHAAYRLELVPLAGTRVEGVGERVALVRGGGVRFALTAMTSEEPLTPLEIGRLLREGHEADPDALRVLAFLSYEEKLLAGSWRFLTYFGRDTLISTRLLMPVLSPVSIESALGAVFARLSAEGRVAHEEDLGDFALHRRAAEGGPLSAEPVYDYKMVDDDFMLAPVASRYLLDVASEEQAEAFLSREGNREGLRRNLEFVLSASRPYADQPGVETLITARAGEYACNWRDSEEGLGRGRTPYDVNVVLVPAALRAARRLYDSGLLGETGARAEEARRLSEAWSDTGRYFEVRLSREDADERSRIYAEAIGVPVEGWAGDSEVRFGAVALDGRGRPVEVAHSDDGFLLLFGEPSEETLLRVARLWSTPFPAGLATPVGMVVANPAYVTDSEVQALFSRGHYHGTVVWSWQHALALQGLHTQLERLDLSAQVRAALEEARTILWRGVEASASIRSSELWTFAIHEDGQYEVEGFGLDAGHRSEANAAQLWSTVFLAIPRR